MAQWMFIWMGLVLASPQYVIAAESDAEKTDTATQQTNPGTPPAKAADSAAAEDDTAKKDKAEEESSGGSEPDCE